MNCSIRRLNGWFENIYKVYAESFRNEKHLQAIVSEAQAIVSQALGGGEQRKAAAARA